ncbi:hypothetical protein B296_00024194 [Ensete ventricosum]|uniref:Uncharacterized protein n=1 Tax=Ensete ventricosum TaxID=4639 RepID=A0A427A113_ENSVE|nr:hypothetical protein B296_00024194 [Ensete ventricosum]
MAVHPSLTGGFPTVISEPSKRSEETRQSAMARSSARVVGHGQAPYIGSRPQPSYLQRGGWLLPRPPTKGRSTAASPQGRQPPTGTIAYIATPIGAAPAARATASRGSDVGCKGGCQRARAATAYIGATVVVE